MLATKTPNRRKTRGQGMTEYIIVVALIAIGTIGVITLFGDNIRALFGASADALAGNQSPNNNAKQTSQSNALQQQKTLQNFGQNSY